MHIAWAMADETTCLALKLQGDLSSGAGHRVEVEAVIVVLGRMQMVHSAAQSGCQHVVFICELAQILHSRICLQPERWNSC